MATDTQQNRLLAALGYPIWIVALIIILTDIKKDPYARYHGWQALFFGIAWLVVSVAFGILSAIPVINIIAGILGIFVPLVWFILAVVFAVKAYNGEEFTIPVVSDFASRYSQPAEVTDTTTPQ